MRETVNLIERGLHKQSTAHKSVISERKNPLLAALRQLLQLIKLKSSIHAITRTHMQEWSIYTLT